METLSGPQLVQKFYDKYDDIQALMAQSAPQRQIDWQMQELEEVLRGLRSRHQTNVEWGWQELEVNTGLSEEVATVQKLFRELQRKTGQTLGTGLVDSLCLTQDAEELGHLIKGDLKSQRAILQQAFETAPSNFQEIDQDVRHLQHKWWLNKSMLQVVLGLEVLLIFLTWKIKHL